jgi:hypothetical protein
MIDKYVCLQELCKLRKPPANYYTAFTRQRSLVRTQHRPLPNRSFCGLQNLRPDDRRALGRITTGVWVQR